MTFGARYALVVGLVAAVVSIGAPAASANIFKDAVKTVKKTGKKAVNTVKNVTGVSKLEQRERVKKENARNRAQAAAQKQAEAARQAKARQQAQAKQQLNERERQRQKLR